MSWFLIRRNVSKFKSLRGIVALVFLCFFLRALYCLWFYVSFWNLLSAVLLGIFALWSWKNVLGTPGCASRRYTRVHPGRKWDRDLDL